ncbi:MAG: TonB-dependent receptor plug domain-containing protein, partial [Verrucomicrobiae bacterium]|nr:TonB-dependent receptor plug domain-containing protein [Verrucomicrobiae bacterium]
MQKFAVAVLLFVVMCAVAADPTNVVSQLPEMVVTASRLPGQEEVVSKMPAHVTLVSRPQIQQSPSQTLPELLSTQPGMQNIDTLGFGLFSSPNMRGYGERTGVLVLVDGVRVNNPGDSTQSALWTAIPPQDIERIEIIRGGGSHVYGEGAIGGVINIITRKGDKEPSGTAEVAAGNFGYLRGHISGGGAFGAGRAYGSGTYEEGDGPRDGSAFYKETAQGSLGVTTPWGDLDATVYFHKDRLRNPGNLTYEQFHKDPTQVGEDGSYLFENEITRLTFDWKKTFDSGFSFHIKPYAQNYFEHIWTPATEDFGASEGEINQPSWGITTQLDHVADVLGGQNRATLGGEFIRQDFMSVWR